MIRSVRQILRTVLKEQLVSDETLLTVMAEAMNILNSRPLTRNSNSAYDLEPLTPNHLLHLRPSASLPPGIFEKDDLYGSEHGGKHNTWPMYSGEGGSRSTCQPLWKGRNGIHLNKI